MATSPFRSYLVAERQEAAETLVRRRTRALRALERRWAGEGAPRKQRLLLTQVEATRANLRSWEDYLSQGCPRVRNATTIV